MAVAVLLAATTAHAEDRAPIRLELDACLDTARDDIVHAVRVEIGGDDAGDPVAVRITCAAEGLDAGVVLDVRPPDSPRRYRYALDWRAQPIDARPRLIGLAVAEAVDASRIELVAVPEPAPAVVVAPPLIVPRAPSAWSVAIALERRAFSPHAGAAMLGVSIAPARRLTAHLQLAAPLTGEGATVLSDSGALVVRSASIAPRLVYRVGGRVHGELGAGARLGVVRIAGEAVPRSQLVGHRLVRAWGGPTATLAIGAALSDALTVSLGAELGVVAAGATARDLGEPAVLLDGAWAAFSLGATLAL